MRRRWALIERNIDPAAVDRDQVAEDLLPRVKVRLGRVGLEGEQKGGVDLRRTGSERNLDRLG